VDADVSSHDVVLRVRARAATPEVMAYSNYSPSRI